MADNAPPALNVLVFDGAAGHDWPEAFSGVTLSNGAGLNIFQTSWIDTSIVDYDSGCFVTVMPVNSSVGVRKPEHITFKPDLVLVRNQARGPTPKSDCRHQLYALMHADVPSLNSLESVYMNLERPIMFGALKRAKKKMEAAGKTFPLIDQYYYSTPQTMVVSPDCPCVVKVSHAHAGMGKACPTDYNQFRDLSTVLALHGDYCTAEAFIDSEWGIRIQKIGTHYRVLKKHSTGSTWKSQFGGSVLENVEPTEEYIEWVEAAAAEFGMDWCALDVMVGVDGNHYIIELNGSAIGFQTSDWVEDTGYIIELAVERLEEVYCGAGGDVGTSD